MEKIKKVLQDAINQYSDIIRNNNNPNDIILYVFQNAGYNGVLGLYRLFKKIPKLNDYCDYIDSLYYINERAIYSKDKQILLGIYVSSNDKKINIKLPKECSKIDINVDNVSFESINITK